MFSGTLGKVPDVKVKLKLKKNIKPFHSRPYSISKVFEALAKEGIKDLVDIGVLAESVRTAYSSSSFSVARATTLHAGDDDDDCEED